MNYDADNSPTRSAPERLLPYKPFVSLTEAISWLAFGTALAQNEFGHHIATGSFGSETEAERQCRQALDRLLDAVVEKMLQMQAEPSDGGNYRPGVPRDITPEEARVYREHYEPDECLKYLHPKDPDGSTSFESFFNEAPDTSRSFYNVAVNRRNLMALAGVVPIPMTENQDALLGVTIRSRNLTGTRVDDGASAREWTAEDLSQFAAKCAAAEKKQGETVTLAESYWPHPTNRPPRQVIREAHRKAMADRGKIVRPGKQPNSPQDSISG